MYSSLDVQPNNKKTSTNAHPKADCYAVPGCTALGRIAWDVMLVALRVSPLQCYWLKSLGACTWETEKEAQRQSLARNFCWIRGKEPLQNLSSPHWKNPQDPRCWYRRRIIIRQIGSESMGVCRRGMGEFRWFSICRSLGIWWRRSSD